LLLCYYTVIHLQIHSFPTRRSSDLGGFILENIPGAGPSSFTQSAVSTHFPAIGSGFVALALLFFAFTTLMAYYYIAETNLSYLYSKGTKKWMLWSLRGLIMVATFYGTI